MAELLANEMPCDLINENKGVVCRTIRFGCLSTLLKA